MARDQPISVKDTVYKLQLSLLEGIQNEDQLFAAGSVLSCSDYEDVVTERSIVNLCGYPLCSNPLPAERPCKGRYRISLKEHKVYDLHETYMFCSSSCVINSRAFAGSLQEERSSVLDPAKLTEVLKLFEDLSLDHDGMGKNGDLGFSNLKIQEKAMNNVGEESLEWWLGPSNAIEGYVPHVPQRDLDSKPLPTKSQRGSTANRTEHSGKKDDFCSDMDFMSTIIMEDEYSISKDPSCSRGTGADMKLKEQKGKVNEEDSKAQSSAVKRQGSGKTSRKSKVEKNKAVIKEGLSSQDGPTQTSCSVSAAGAEEKSLTKKGVTLREYSLKSSLKSSGAKKLSRSVTWADENVAGSRNLCEVKEIKDKNAGPDTSSGPDAVDDGNALRYESAEACAAALSLAVEAVASGNADVTDAICEAGVIILPRPNEMDQGDSKEDVDAVEKESDFPKWPEKPGVPRSEYFDPEDSWYDAPPEGFSLMLSPFATMWMALFAWVTSSSLAHIYGRDESSHEDYLIVNGREYPWKIVLQDGRSAEIKQTVEGCLSRASPAVVQDLLLAIPVSVLEQGMANLLDTMSFLDAVPAFRTKQWQVIALLFLEALSVCRIPTLASLMTNRRMVLHKVLAGAQISTEEYEIMKDLMMPLGRAPQFSAESGA